MTSTKTISPGGTETWRLPNHRLHREDGPAVTFETGEKWWCVNHEYHREDGPAITHPVDGFSWYLRGNRYGINEYCSMLRSHYNKADEDIMMIRMQYETK